MMETKTYCTVLDDGHDYIDFEFESTYRANSRPNKEDCKAAYFASHSYRDAARIDWNNFTTWRKGK